MARGLVMCSVVGPADNIIPARAAALQRARGRLQVRTAVVHKLFRDYEDCIRNESRACGLRSLSTIWDDDLASEADLCADTECAEARARTTKAKADLLAAVRKLNEEESLD